MSSDVCATGLA